MGWIALGGIFSKMQGCRRASVVGLWLWSVKLGLGHLPRDTRVFIQADNSFFPLFVTHTHWFNGPFSGTTQVSRYQKGKTNQDFTGARDNEWQWHQLGHMQVCTLLQTDTTPAPHHSGFYRPDALPAAQPTVSKHCQQNCIVLLTFFTKEIFHI